MPVDLRVLKSNHDPILPQSHEAGIGDLRFRKLLSDAAWNELPPPVRRRFAKRVGPGDSVVYVGTISEMRMSRAGWLLSQVARLIGAPLPTSAEIGVPAVVTVTEDAVQGGQVWTRLYASRHGFPQVINSAKRFQGRTGLEEHVGAGIGMSLAVAVQNGVLCFLSVRYFLAVGTWRITLPGWLTPGDLTVTHAERGGGRFDFTLSIVHSWLGELIYQRGEFSESAA